ncbi:MAG TPA: glycosyltransferase family 4 protein [Solirubrobacteraceae bacterium]|nr:glycosyltransferase family 4 protein [Solirubrobacteraceae bacterium]
MRALLISWEYPPVIEGGLGRHVRKLSEHLARDGVEMHVLTRGGGRLRAHEERHGVSVHRVREPPYPKNIDAFVRWVGAMNADMYELGMELCERFEFDLVHSHDWLVAGAAERVARRLGRPWLTTIHATEFGRHQGWVKTYPQSHIHARERAMARRADRIITCSRYMRSHVATVFGVPATKVTVIPNGIDPRDLEPVVADLSGLRARFAAPGDRLVLLVGRLVYEKGFHLALDALAPVIRRSGSVRFVVAGTGTAESELKGQARRLGLQAHGSFLGWVGDDMLHSLYRVADLCIVPSIYEPFGLVALEAMASGCLCIVADTGGLREVVPGDGSVGLRFPSRDSVALGELLERVLTDDAGRARVIAEARAHVLRFDWAAVARRTGELYGALAGERRTRGPAAESRCAAPSLRASSRHDDGG